MKMSMLVVDKQDDGMVDCGGIAETRCSWGQRKKARIVGLERIWGGVGW